MQPMSTSPDSAAPSDKHTQFLGYFLPVKGRLERYARALTSNDEDARDIVGETVLLAYEQFHNVKNREAFVFYLFTIARRLYKRRVWRRRIFGELNEDHAMKISDGGTQPDTYADIGALRAALADLPERTREALVLFELSGLSLAEIQTMQGGSLSGVKSRVMRGRKQVARLLGVAFDNKANGERYAPQRPGANNSEK